jgi:predicted NAD/FAD-binding protein
MFMKRVAVIGTGISGMACAHKIQHEVDLTVFEAEIRPGGHTHTVDVHDALDTLPVDTGFMVYNEVTYPLLTQLFDELGVKTRDTDMSFGVQVKSDALEFSGSSLSGLFSQRLNLFRPRFLRMLKDIVRFNAEGVAALEEPDTVGLSLVEFVRKHRFGDAFLNHYLVPMTSAIWSTPPDRMLEFPAHTLLRFMHNHGLLGVKTHHQWRTVVGGSRSYRDKLLAPFRHRIQCGNPVQSVRETESGMAVRDASGRIHTFDQVVIATHADTALGMLEAPSRLQQRLLSCFPYAANTITLHTDSSVMPTSRRAWASWNYRLDPDPRGPRASTHYWMNRLQHLPSKIDYFVSVNEPGVVDRGKVLREFTFDHPMFDKRAVDAQFELPLLNENGKIYYCGSYFRYGFHEDGLMSGYAAADRLLSPSALHAELAV